MPKNKVLKKYSTQENFYAVQGPNFYVHGVMLKYQAIH